MILNILKPLANAICISCYEPAKDNSLRTENCSITYGTIIFNDCTYMYIRIKDTNDDELLFDVSMPIVAYRKCRYEIQVELEAVLKEM